MKTIAAAPPDFADILADLEQRRVAALQVADDYAQAITALGKIGRPSTANVRTGKINRPKKTTPAIAPATRSTQPAIPKKSEAALVRDAILFALHHKAHSYAEGQPDVDGLDVGGLRQAVAQRLGLSKKAGLTDVFKVSVSNACTVLRSEELIRRVVGGWWILTADGTTAAAQVAA